VKLTLRRNPPTEDGVFGKLYVPRHGELKTMEDDERANAKGVSCIPAGTYKIRRYHSPKHGYDVFLLVDVPGRDFVEIHPANTEEDVEGCIGLGLRYGVLEVEDEDTPGHPKVTKRAVLDSQAAFRRFMYWMRGINEAELTVEWAK
jgi:hypothetical protein